MSRNVAHLLLARECVGARRGMGVGGLQLLPGCGGAPPAAASTQRALEAWQEADFVQHSAAAYTNFQPAPRSTIALSYNANGTLLASTQ